MKVKKEIIVAVFAIVSVALLLIGISYLQGSSIINRSYVLHATYDNVDGLTVGNKVVVNGYKVGQVKDLKFDPNTQKTSVYFDVTKDVKIPKDSKATLASFDFFGSKCLRITFGKSAELVADGGSLPGDNEVGMVDNFKNELIPVKNKVENVIDEVNVIAKSLRKQFQDSSSNVNNILRNVDATSGNFVAISSDVRGTIGRINQLTDSLNGLMGQIKAYDPQVKTILNNAGDLTQNLNKNSGDIRSIVQNAKVTTDELKLMLEKVNKGEGALGQLMNDKKLYNNLTAAGASLDSLLVDLKKHPKRYVHFSLFGRKDK